jgi:hypothetical protein
LKNDLIAAIYGIVVSSTADADHQNKRVSFKLEVQEKIDKVDTASSFELKNCPKQNLEILMITYQLELDIDVAQVT